MLSWQARMCLGSACPCELLRCPIVVVGCFWLAKCSVKASFSNHLTRTKYIDFDKSSSVNISLRAECSPFRFISLRKSPALFPTCVHTQDLVADHEDCRGGVGGGRLSEKGGPRVGGQGGELGAHGSRKRTPAMRHLIILVKVNTVVPQVSRTGSVFHYPNFL